jgi:hypothetical protein
MPQQIPQNERPHVGSVLDNTTSARFYALWGSVANAAATLIPPARRITDFLPKPLDYMQHASNASGSLFFGYIAGQGIARLAARFNRSPRQVQIITLALGVTVLAAANALVETHTGYNLIYAVPHMADVIGPLGSVTDPADLGWGIAGGAAGAAIAAADVRGPEPAQSGNAGSETHILPPGNPSPPANS